MLKNMNVVKILQMIKELQKKFTNAFNNPNSNNTRNFVLCMIINSAKLILMTANLQDEC